MCRGLEDGYHDIKKAACSCVALLAGRAPPGSLDAHSAKLLQVRGWWCWGGFGSGWSGGGCSEAALLQWMGWGGGRGGERGGPALHWGGYGTGLAMCPLTLADFGWLGPQGVYWERQDARSA